MVPWSTSYKKYEALLENTQTYQCFSLHQNERVPLEKSLTCTCESLKAKLKKIMEYGDCPWRNVHLHFQLKLNSKEIYKIYTNAVLYLLYIIRYVFF